MIEQKTDTYYINSFHSRFSTKEEAEKDEVLRGSRPMRLACSPGGLGDFRSPDIEVVGDHNGVFGRTYSPSATTHRVFLFKDLIAYCQRQIQKHGENAGWMRVHQGMMQYGDVIVKVEPNPLHPKAQS